MNYIAKILFSVLFIFKETLPISGHTSFEYDITKRLDTCIANMLTKVSSDMIWNKFNEMGRYVMSEFEYAVDVRVELFPHNVTFRDMRFKIVNCVLPKFEWNFDENKLHVFAEKLNFNAVGKLRVRKNETYQVHVQLIYNNFALNLTASQNDRDNRKLSTSYDSLVIRRGYFHNDFFTTFTANSMSSDQTKELQLIITEAVPQIFVEALDRNQTFGTIYETYKNWKNDLISTYPNFVTDKQLFYYLIPKVPFFCFHFKCIVIKGLSNFQLVQIHFAPKIFTHILLIRNVVGKMTLDYGTSEEKPMKLRFRIDYLTISINRETNVVNANARFYCINGTTGPLTYRQSPMIMHEIESAIASSVMSMMKVEKTRYIDIVQKQIQVTKSSDWKEMKESYKEWIPFNDDNAQRDRKNTKTRKGKIVD